jgi:hypothetical protein
MKAARRHARQSLAIPGDELHEIALPVAWRVSQGGWRISAQFASRGSVRKASNQLHDATN